MSKGRFVWFDLMTTNPDSARGFYSALFGWTIAPHGPDGSYHMISAGSVGIGGIVPMKDSDHVPNMWAAYVTVDDLSASLAQVAELGGKTLVPAVPIPGTGEFAMIADRQGASIGIIRLDNDTPTAPPAKGANGIGWAELQTSDPDDALRFYTALFGWKSESWDMGGSNYWLVGDEHNAGIMKSMGNEPPNWLLYATVESADAMVAEAARLGGHVVYGPADIPDVGRFAVLVDPTGAAFAVMQSKPRPM
jgi:hypothetical protein